MKRLNSSAFYTYLKPVYDLIVTLLLWSYYTIGFVVFFSPFYLIASLFSKNREIAFQHLNHYFYRGFLFLTRILIPWGKWHIDDEVLKIRSSVIVCNHISYLDPIILISLFKKQKTIVKNRFFKIPIFRRVIEWSGYIPASAEGKLSGLMIQRIEEMDHYLRSGGNFFVFPEGTRARSGTLGRLNKGAFKIARLCKQPIRVLFIRHTDQLFEPGRFLFNTSFSNTITVEHLASIETDDQNNPFSISELMLKVRSLLEAKQAESFSL